MSGPEGGDEPITVEEQAEVSRWLAEAAGPLVLPGDVAARLEDVLEDLVAERADAAPDGADDHHGDDDLGDDLVGRRRRWPRLLLAAAAVLVVGYGVASVTGDGSLSGSGGAQSDSASAGRTEAGGTADSMSAGQPAGSAGADSASSDDRLGTTADRRSAPPAPSSGEHEPSLGRFPPRLRSDRLDVGARRALRYLDADATGGLLLDDVEGAQCVTPDLAPGERSLPVRYDGRAASLVSRPVSHGGTQVTVYSCDGAEIDRTTLEP